MTAAEHHLYHEPLMAGERMDQPTFHARYEECDSDFRAELVGGTVHLMTPVSEDHSRQHTSILWWLTEYEIATPGTAVRADLTVVLGPHSEPQPDACLRILEACGGRSRVINRYLHGAPELMVEIAVSSRLRDLSQKKKDYEMAGVDELLVVVPEEEHVFWFHLVDGRYRTLPADPEGILRSRRFPGLWLDPAALLADDKPKMRAALFGGLTSPEHGEWAEAMGKKTKSHDGIG